MEFGETLAQLRRNKNLSQAQLAAQLYDMRWSRSHSLSGDDPSEPLRGISRCEGSRQEPPERSRTNASPNQLKAAA